MAERSVLIVQNIPREGPGIIQQVLDINDIKSTVVDLSQTLEAPPINNFGAVVVMGGPDSANDTSPKMKAELAIVRGCLNKDKPYLGICLGMQDLVHEAGGEVVTNPVRLREVGLVHPDQRPYSVKLTDIGRNDPLFEGLKGNLRVFHLHGETVILTGSIKLLATGDIVRNQIVKVGENAYGIQSHFELTPEMLDLWLSQDPWLLEKNAQEIKRQFGQIKEEYTQTAWQMFTNFLRVANFI